VTETIGGRVVIVDASEPARRDAVVEFGGGRVTSVRDIAPWDEGPGYDVVLPGLVDAHSHARGVPLADHGVGDGPLERFLVELRALTPLSPADEALVAGDAALATGITSVQAMHHDFGDVREYARRAIAMADGYTTAGVRAFIALGLTDQGEFVPAWPGSRTANDAVAEPRRGMSPDAFRLLGPRLLGQHDTVHIDAVGPVAPQWCTDRALRAIRDTQGAARVHTHLLESARQRLAPGGDPVARLQNAGLLTAASSLAHGVWLDDGQIDRIAASGAVIVHCPGSNARLAGATCRVRRLIDAGITVALGLDSHGATAEPDAFAEMRLALRAAADAGLPLTAAEVLIMATTGGARALGRPDLGTLRPGATADIVALNLAGAATAPDPIEHLVMHADPGNVAVTWVSGRRTQPGRAATCARARLAAAMRDDAVARTARVAETATAWQATDAVWREVEAGPAGNG
jgi:cytosine/adenosine deaminase-related metal-dependent hydrolase